MIYGYARSSDDAERDAAVRALEEHGCDAVSADAGSRVFFDEVVAGASDADTVVVPSLSLLAPDVCGVLDALARIECAGATFMALDEGIEAAPGDPFFSHMGALSKVASRARSRTIRNGMGKARAKGGSVGKPAADSSALEEAMSMKKSGEFTVREIVKATGVSKATLYRHLGKAGAGDT